MEFGCPVITFVKQVNNFSMFKVLYFYFLTSRKGALTKTVVPDLIEVGQQVARLPDTGEIGMNI